MAKIGDRKIEYLKGVRDMGLLDGMTRFRMVSDLKMFGIDIKDSFWINAETVRKIYQALIEGVLGKGNE